MRNYSLFDHVLFGIDAILKDATGFVTKNTRLNPAAQMIENDLTELEKNHVAGLMRVNHVGEVCAQALYQGQSLTAQDKKIQQKMEQAAEEEKDHLAWCKERILELNSHTSYLNPFWYTSSLLIGLFAGLAGDKINLGFLAETERQVEQHLTRHLEKLPTKDLKSRAIVEQMRADEIQHAITAEESGATKLPLPIKFAMRCLSKVMTTTAYWI